MRVADPGLAVVPHVAQSETQPLGVLGATKIVVRWFPIVIPLIALSVYLSLTLTSSIQPEFTAQASLLLTGPNEVLTIDVDTGELLIEEVNPLNQLGGSLPTVAQVTSISLTDTETLNELENRGLASVYNVWNENRSPIINAEAVNSDEAIAADTVSHLLGLIQADLVTRQDALDAPLTSRIVAEPIDEVSVSNPDFSGRTRTRLGLAAVGLALSVASAFLFEGLRQLYLRSRARNRAAISEEARAVFDERSTGVNPDAVSIKAGSDETVGTR